MSELFSMQAAGCWLLSINGLPSKPQILKFRLLRRFEFSIDILKSACICKNLVRYEAHNNPVG